MQHLVFYDGDCPLCNRVVRFLLAKDQKQIFLYAPLNGTTAQHELANFHQDPSKSDTLIFLENYQTNHQHVLIRSKAALRILWHLGGKYKWLGWLSFLPSYLFDIVYRLIAINRYKLFSNPQNIDMQRFTNRFLP